MAIRKEERWRCQNPFCNGEILVTSSSEVEDGANPRCSCGSLMKKPYVLPTLKSHLATEEARALLELPASLQSVVPLTSRLARREG